ncbi:MAG: hypothetical protein JWP16_363 [Alphaproteobacteria bacterium]|nr:hypothetical protein [Alphaproteobacteria bacterium]
MRNRIVLLGALLGACVCTGALAAPVNAVKAGELVIDPPTLMNLGFEWLISGDDNRNATVAVSYRKKGDKAWKAAMPLMRLGGERVYQSEGVFNVKMPNMFAGSILDLQENTEYEARFVLSDPDGGKAVKIVTAKTRPEPMPATGGHVYHVYPRDWKGAREPGSFNDLMCAYNYYCGGGDTVTGGRPRVQAGDTILVHAGTYRYHPEFYTGDKSINSTTPVEGTYYLFGNGTPEKPIVIKSAGDGEVVFDGGGNFNLFNVKAANYNYFEGLTFRNTQIAIWAGTQFIAGSRGLTVKHSRFENINLGIFTNYAGSSNFYIADNYFIGRDDAEHLSGWNGALWKKVDEAAGIKFPPTLDSYTAVRLYGGGHVVAYNYVANFHDGIDVETYGDPDGNTPRPSAATGPFYPDRKDWHLRPVAIDFYNNYMTNFHDNAFEADGSMHNVRIMRNMMLNSASHPFCNQPDLGGPIYWIRNIAYNAPGGSTRLTSGSAGAVFLNNTILTETNANSSANVHWKNNLMLGQNSAPAILAVTTYTNYSSSDYNGFRLNPGAEYAFQWTSPEWGLQQDYRDLLGSTGADQNPRNTVLAERRFKTLAAYSAATHQDAHSTLVDYDIFQKVPMLDARDLGKISRLYDAKDLDFSLRPGSAAVDHGAVIPNVTDGYAGAAPDLGALELGQPAPHYGPRS